MKNRGAFMTDLDKMEIRDIPMPTPKEKEVLVELEYVGICGSDVHYFHDGRCGSYVVDGDFMLGHECAGTVVELGEGVISIDLTAKQDLFYNVLEEKSGFKIDGDHQLLNLVTKLSRVKNEYDKIESALYDAKTKGYGVVAPSLDELSLEEPEIIKQGKQYGIKLRANAPSLHIIKADISTEVSPIVGNQTQGEEMIKYLLDTFEENPSELWASNMFGKSLNDLVKEQLQSKLYTMPEEIRVKIQKTLQKIINEGSMNIITILL